MSTGIIPTSTDALYTQVTTLDGSDFVFTFSWNGRESAWYFDIADQDGVPIAMSIKVTVETPLLRRCADPRQPKGLLWAADTTGQGLDPGRNDLGERVLLLFVSFDDATLSA